MSSSNFCFLTCIQIFQDAGKVVWYSHLLKNFPQFVVIHTVKGSKAEVDVFLELSWHLSAFIWISLVPQLVKNLPAIQETQAWFLGQEDHLEKGRATYSLQYSWAQMVRIHLQCGSLGVSPWVGKIPWRRLPTPVFLPRDFHGQRNLAGYSRRGCKESDMTEQLSLALYTCLEQQVCLPLHNRKYCLKHDA